jgi:cysteine-rich repeat protein
MSMQPQKPNDIEPIAGTTPLAGIFGVLLTVLLSTACIADFYDPPIPPCGDRHLTGEEGCDDGNTLDADGCSASCAVETGWQCQGAPSICATLCGDGIRADVEVCDGADLGGATCVSLFYTGGALQCTTLCTYNEELCAACGDGLCDANQEEVGTCQADCGFVQIAVGWEFSCGVRGDQTLWCWGSNDHGQLGDGSTVPFRNTPVRVAGISAALQVDVAGTHACALVLQDETQPTGATDVWCWGENGGGQVGSTDLTNQHTPVKVPDLGARVDQIEVGWRFSCARLEGGIVKCWGNNMYGAGPWSLGSCSFWDNYSAEPIQTDFGDALSLSIDASNGCVLQSSGDVLCWGANASGERGDGTTDASCVATYVDLASPVTSIVMGDHFAIALESGGDAWSWGVNEWGQLGDTTVENRLSPVRVLNIPALKRVGLGWHHGCATTTQDAAYCWGRNDEGQLGTGTADATFLPPNQVVDLDAGVLDAQAGELFSCALLTSGRIQCWGANYYGQLGNGSGQDSALPVEVLLP